MQDFVVHELASGLEIAVAREAPPLASAVEAEVERLWQSAQARLSGALFNGRVFSADTITAERIGGHFTEFRRIVAQMAQPELYEELQLRPLAVNGIVRLADGILFGLRSPLTAYQAGMWQLPPAGSVDLSAVDATGRIDLVRQLLKELSEETGIAAERCHVGQPLCIVEHPGSRVLDIGIPVALPLTGAAVLACHERVANDEYDPLQIVPESELAAWLAMLGDELVPSARIFLAHLGLIG